ncbi:MAG: sensor histidine kinase [bacterium]
MIKRKLLKVVFAHLVIWICFLIFPLTAGYMEFGRIPGEMIIRTLVGSILLYYNYFFLVPKFLLKKKFVSYVILSIISLAIFNFLLINYFSNETLDHFKKLLTVDPEAKFVNGIRYFIPFAFSLTLFLLGGILRLVFTYFERERNAKILEANQKEAQIQFLRTQLNPHFLFNTLNGIYSLVRTKSDNAPDAILTLSELMRYMLYEVGESKVLLKKELNYINNYVELQKLRLKRSDQISLSFNGDPKNLKIQPLILITYIENAFKYGTDFQGRTQIIIKIKVIDNTLHFYIENPFITKKSNKDNSGIGQMNIRKQLDLIYAENYDLTISSNDGFYKVNLKINLI